MTQDDNVVFSADLSNPDLMIGGQIALRHEQIHLHRIKFVWNAACFERLLVRNFSEQSLNVRLSVRFASDFADLFEVRGERRAAHGVSFAELENDHGVLLRYLGLDGIARATRLTFAPAPRALTTARAAYELALKPHEALRIFMRYGVPETAEWSDRGFYRRMRAARHALRESSARAASIDSSNTVFNEILRRSVSDLCMLVTETPHGPVSVCRNAVVQHPIRSRRHRHRAHDAVARSHHRERRTALSRCYPGHRKRAGA